MDCAELMKTDVECCNADDSVVQVAKRMLQRNIGFVPICDAAGAVIGTVTDRDLALRVLAEQRDPQTAAKDVMSNDVVCCRATDSLSVAEELMSRYKKSRIVCVDEDMHPVGVISLSDIAKTERSGRASAVLRSVSQRESRS